MTILSHNNIQTKEIDFIYERMVIYEILFLDFIPKPRYSNSYLNQNTVLQSVFTYSDGGEDLVEADVVTSVEVRARAQGRQGQGGLKTGGAGGTLRQGRRPGRVVGGFAGGQLSVERP